MTQDYAYFKRWQYDRDRGVARTVATGPVSAHIAGLLDAGWTQRGIAEVTGLPTTTVLHVTHARYGRTNRDIAARLLAVQADTPRPVSGYLPKIGAVRRIQALMAIGHRHQDITAAIRSAGSSHRSQLVLHQAGELIERRTHRAVCTAYDALSMTPGPSTQTVRRAQALGYLPPLAYDDDALDRAAEECVHITNAMHSDVDARLEPMSIDEIAISEAIHGRRVTLTSAETTEAIRRLAAMRLNDTEIGERLGMTSDAVCQRRGRNGIASQTPAMTPWRAA